MTDSSASGLVEPRVTDETTLLARRYAEALIGAAETLLAELPARNLLKPGSRSGELAGHRWRVDIAPLNMAAREVPQTSPFVPLAVILRLQAPSGPAIQVTTVRLVPKSAE